MVGTSKKDTEYDVITYTQKKKTFSLYAALYTLSIPTIGNIIYI